MRHLIVHVSVTTLIIGACTAPPLATNQGIVPILLSYPSKGDVATRFQAKALEAPDTAKAKVQVFGSGITTPVEPAGNPVTLVDGKNSAQLSVIVPPGPNRVFAAQAVNADGTAMPSWLAVKAVANVVAGNNPPILLGWQSTPTAKVIDALRTANSPYADSVNTTQLQALVDHITQPTVNGAQTTFAVHPALVDADALATAIIAGNGAVPGTPPANVVMSAGTIHGHVSGLPPSAIATINANDPSSTPVLTDQNGDFDLPLVAPAAGIRVTAAYFAVTPGSSVTSVASGGTTTVSLTVGANNYVDRTLYSGSGITNAVVRWTNMPIKILFVRPSVVASQSQWGQAPDPSKPLDWVQHSHEDSVIDAFQRWDDHVGDLISYSFSSVLDNDPNVAAQKAAADIVVRWTSDTFGGRLGDVTPTFGVFSGGSPKATDLHMEMALYCVPAHGYLSQVFPMPQYTYEQWRQAAIHFAGHALGLVGDAVTGGHSTVPADVMYEQAPLPMNPTNIMPTLRDVNTMRQLYSMPADITKL